MATALSACPFRRRPVHLAESSISVKHLILMETEQTLIEESLYRLAIFICLLMAFTGTFGELKISQIGIGEFQFVR